MSKRIHIVLSDEDIECINELSDHFGKMTESDCIHFCLRLSLGASVRYRLPEPKFSPEVIAINHKANSPRGVPYVPIMNDAMKNFILETPDKKISVPKEEEWKDDYSVGPPEVTH